MIAVRFARQLCLVAFLLPALCLGGSLDTKAIDSLVAETLRAWNVPGAAVAITRGDEVVYLKGAGVREWGRPEPVTPDTRFAIGSTTKAFTTAAIAMLVDEGKMSWDEPVRKHLDFFHLSDPLADEQCTLRDLLSHRTGLSRHDMLWYGSNWDREEVIKRVGRVRLTMPFRSGFQYQNIMFLAAGEALARASGTTWESFVRARLLEPLGMRDTDFSVTETVAAPNRATPHRKDGAGAAIPVEWRKIDNIGPAGAMNSTARDLTKWLRLQVNGGVFDGKQLITAKNLGETHTPQTVIRLDQPMRMLTDEMTQLSYGMGWFVNDYRGHLVVSHGGAIDGFRANITLLPKQKVGIAVLSNMNQVNMPEALRDAIVDVVLGLPRVDWNTRYLAKAKQEEAEQRAREERLLKADPTGNRPSREVLAYAGDYSDPAYGTVHVRVDDGELIVEWNALKGRLAHRYFDTFVTHGGSFGRMPAVFRLGTDGRVESLVVMDVEFRRAPARMVAGN
ncbi:MAG: serine hydrolase [Bryobacteraceae bacterium]|nr:serine hydrolase [Bryobacteraceae bacterium]